MKRVYYCLGSILVIAIVFSGFYYFSYKQTLRHLNERMEKMEPFLLIGDSNSIEKNGTIRNSIKELSQKVEEHQNLRKEQENKLSNMEVQAADSTTQNRITPSTRYKLEQYDIVTNQTTEEVQNIPEYLLGLTREEVIGYLSSYMSNMPLAEQQKGLQAYELVAFSEEEVTIKKTYNSDAVLYKYCIVVRDGMVVVYYCDKKTVYEYTGISYLDLPEEEQQKLMDGIYIETDEELYGILENYSS